MLYGWETQSLSWGIDFSEDELQVIGILLSGHALSLKRVRWKRAGCEERVPSSNYTGGISFSVLQSGAHDKSMCI